MEPRPAEPAEVLLEYLNPGPSVSQSALECSLLNVFSNSQKREKDTFLPFRNTNYKTEFDLTKVFFPKNNFFIVMVACLPLLNIKEFSLGIIRW